MKMVTVFLSGVFCISMCSVDRIHAKCKWCYSM